MSDAGGVCISCLETDNVFNIFDTHECEGIEEIYVDMLRSCFDIEISKNEAVNFMCEKCILILRQAYYFKQNILQQLKELKINISKHIHVEYLDEIHPSLEADLQLDPKTGELFFSVDNYRAPNGNCKSLDTKYENYENLSKSQANHEVVDKSPSKEEECLLNSVKKEKRENLIKPEDNFRTETTEDGSETGKEETPSEPVQFECAHCGKRFPSKVAITRHIKTHLEGPFSCHLCGQLFSKLNSRNSHMWRAHQLTPYACAYCPQRFRTFHQRLVHVRDEHGRQREYPCPYCDNVYSYAGARSTHIRGTHLRVHNHPCSECKMGFFKRRALLNHLASIHGIGEKKFVCPICSKSFYRNPILRNHMKMHTEKLKDKQYKCSKCPAEFTFLPVLRNHMKCHELDPHEQSVLQDTDSTGDHFIVIDYTGQITTDEPSEAVYYEVM